MPTSHRAVTPTASKGSTHMGTILWLISVVLVIVGIVELVQGALVLGLVLIVLGLLVGPGGVSVFNGRRA